MTLNQQPDLKAAILELPQREKDKLLLRLINKDQKLMKQLHFQLLEGESDLIDRVKTAYADLDNQWKTGRVSVNRSPQSKKHLHLNLLLKYCSGIINEHVTTTKDKASELELRLYLLDLAFCDFPELYNSEVSGYKSDKHFAYQAGRIKLIYGIFSKFHEDLQYQYREPLLKVLKFAEHSALESLIHNYGISSFELE